MRIRKRQVPLPFSSISPVPLASDPNFNRSPVVQLPLQQPQQPPTSSFDPCRPSDHADNHAIGQLPTQGRDSSALQPGTSAHGEDDAKQKKKDDYLVLNQGGDGEERGGDGEKSNDTRKKSVVGAELGTRSRPQSSSSHQAVGRWGEGEKAFPLKKRRGSFERRGNNSYDDDDDDDNVDSTIIMEKDGSSSGKKVQMMNNNNKMKTKMNKKFVQQQNNDNHEQDQENKESKDGVVAAAGVDSSSSNNPIGAKKRGRGGALMEGSRCSRVNGRGWRCCQQTLVGYSLCEHHLGKGRLRSMNSVRSRSLAAKKEEQQQQPKNDDNDQDQQQPSSNSSPSQQAKQISKRESPVDQNGENGKEENQEDDQKPLMMSKKRLKLGMVKARSISSLLGQNDKAIALADDNN